MATINLDGRQVELNPEGFLVDPGVWSDDLALALARQEEAAGARRAALGGHPLHPSVLPRRTRQP